MSDAIQVLADRPEGAGAARLSSRRSVLDALSRPSRGEVWVLPSAEAVARLVDAMASAQPRVRGASVVAYVLPSAVTAQIIESGFARALLGPAAMVPMDELAEIVRSPHPEDFCIAAAWDEPGATLALWRGDLSVVVEPVSAFPPRGGVTPDPARLSVTDCGQAVRLGDYEASFDAILFERDPLYRRRARKRMIASERSLGASIRRLRLRRGVPRDGFPGLDDKTIARIERNEVARPQRGTLAVIAKRLGVSGDELAGS